MSPRACIVPLLVILAAPAEGAAQTGGELVIEAGAARSFPGSATDGDPATYGLGGLVFDWSGERTRLGATVHGGWALDDSLGGHFLAGRLEAEAWSGAATALGIHGRAYGFRVREPFAYRSATVRAGPAVRVLRGGVRLELRLAAGVGTSAVELGVPTRRHGPRHPGGESELNTDLWHWGGRAELAVPLGSFTGSVTGGRWSSAGGAFGTAGAAVLGTVGGLTVRADLGVWDTPLGNEVTGGLAVVVPVGERTRVHAVAGRAPPDPLTLAEAGGQGGALVGYRLARMDATENAPVYVIEPGEEGARVRFQLDVNRGPVAVTGDFTRWEPVEMDRHGDVWTVELSVPSGTWHFGFVVDGDWYVPPGLPGIVPDEWGRQNATLVVPEAEQEERP